MMCDFCCERNVVRVYPAEDFVSSEHPDIGSAGGWAACPECVSLVDGNRLEELAWRALKVNPNGKLLEELMGEANALASIRVFHKQFLAMRKKP